MFAMYMAALFAAWSAKHPPTPRRKSEHRASHWLALLIAVIVTLYCLGGSK